jgi:hypothetical protein
MEVSIAEEDADEGLDLPLIRGYPVSECQSGDSRPD